MKELTIREKEVLQQIFKTNKEIAENLAISVPTVKTHLHNIFEKLEESNRSIIIIKALKMNILQLEDFDIGDWDIFGNPIQKKHSSK